MVGSDLRYDALPPATPTHTYPNCALEGRREKLPWALQRGPLTYPLYTPKNPRTEDREQGPYFRTLYREGRDHITGPCNYPKSKDQSRSTGVVPSPVVLKPIKGICHASKATEAMGTSPDTMKYKLTYGPYKPKPQLNCPM